MEVELALLDPVPQPVETHVDGASSLLLTRAIDDAMGSSVVSL